MKKLLLLGAWVCLAVASYYAVVFITPYYILIKLKVTSGSQFNVPVYSKVVDATERRVVMPNPDFLYTVMGYDVRKHPVKISGVLPDTSYASIALYANNTENYFVANDRRLPTRKYEFIIATRKQIEELKLQGANVIEAESSLGTVITRMLVSEPARVPHIQQAQQSFKAEVLTTL